MAIVTEPSLPVLAPRRTRRNVKQSKKGCFLCRAQRKKCGEEKPCCLRCMRARKICEWSTSRASPIPEPKDYLLSSPCNALSIHLKTDQVQSRFSWLGFEILAQEACSDAFGISSDIWTYLLPQLASVDSTINAAVASLGATYEAVILQPEPCPDPLNSPSSQQYRKALASLQTDISLQSHGPVPLFLASLILAAVELLQRHLTNALVHLRGSFTVLTECIYDLRKSRPAVYGGTPNGGTEPFMEDEIIRALVLMAQALDIQTATYVLSSPPDLPVSSLEIFPHIASPSIHTLSAPQPHAELLPLLHACYHHASLASKYKYISHHEIPTNIALNHGRYIACLSQWLSNLDSGVGSLMDSGFMKDLCTSATPEQFSLLILRSQCVSAIIYLTAILDPKEVAYDTFMPFFKQIVDVATVILDSNASEGLLAGPQKRFRLVSPLSQPLFLTAMKCRHPEIRRKAISLLALTGREGPWLAPVYVRVAQRAVEIEETHMRREGVIAQQPRPTNNDGLAVPEFMRLHGCGVESEAAYHRGKGLIEAHFSRCVDIERMITRSDVPWDSKKNWDMWNETLQI